jgi:hypothetical protein
MGKGHIIVLLIVRLNPIATNVSSKQAVLFLNGSKHRIHL